MLIKVSQVHSQNRCYRRSGNADFPLLLLHQSSHPEGTTQVIGKPEVSHSYIKKICPETFTKQQAIESMDFVQ